MSDQTREQNDAAAAAAAAAAEAVAPRPGDGAAGAGAAPAAKPAPRPVDASDGGLDRILDVPVSASLEVGRRSLSIRELLALDEGSVLEFERSVDEPLDFLVNGTLIARGEIVLVGEKFSVRLTEIVDPSQRILGLRQ